MNKYRHPKSSLFLMEIMINILFFAVLVTICLQLFFKAHTLSENTSVLHHAVTTCTSIAEVYQSNTDGEEIILSVYPNALFLEDTILIYFDENFMPCQKASGTYRAMIEKVADDSAMISFCAFDSTENLYSITVSSYMPLTLNELMGGDMQ